LDHAAKDSEGHSEEGQSSDFDSDEDEEGSDNSEDEEIKEKIEIWKKLGGKVDDEGVEEEVLEGAAEKSVLDRILEAAKQRRRPTIAVIDPNEDHNESNSEDSGKESWAF